MSDSARLSFEAYSDPKLKGKVQVQVSYGFKVALVALDCLFLGLQPVLVHLSKNSKGTYSFHPVARFCCAVLSLFLPAHLLVNFMVELAKTLFALVVLMFTGTGRPGAPMYRSLRGFLVDAHHNRLLAVPAVLYAINNLLKFSMQVWLQSCGSAPNPDLHVPLLPAALCTLGTVTVPAAASVYNEFALKKHMDTSVHLQNFFLYLYGAVFNFGFLAVTAFRQKQALGQMFQGRSGGEGGRGPDLCPFGAVMGGPWFGAGSLATLVGCDKRQVGTAGEGLSLITYLLIANNAAQGLLSSFFYKFADTILKKYSSTIATIWTALLSFAMFGHELTINFFLGVSIVFVSMHQFFTFGDKGKPGETRSKMLYSPSLDHIALAGGGSAGGLSGAQGEGGDMRRPLLPR
ncbi:hypothetical protein VOLCADRAFT_107400 [Volvox carteri f. nagariensis]|uniref:Nucleotide-sugar transporter n=1 Tax=Volvox carteri f. nagariensis TaxID=3068 RepID=D8UDS5_VOLCA|nr:uncharacterized protein VOLCADRAFT_107400 [Volvox carteri f. nagariensis]EFJ42093.1 hypothetical protein VOLCADRAFT_107400 [Volvox carteri f. nagariensis]|eukprot:XP_002956790.1 hypothetical protein VOLCADRAFT_107400 [Volvox carteri f. nagariensis]